MAEDAEVSAEMDEIEVIEDSEPTGMEESEPIGVEESEPIGVEESPETEDETEKCVLRNNPLSYSVAHEHKWSTHLHRLQNILQLYKKVFTSIPTLPFSLSSCRQDNFKSLLDNLSDISKSLRGLHLLQEKEFQDSSIRAHLDDRNNNFETDLSSFIDSALSRTRRRITLDRVFINYPTHPQLLTDPKDIDDAVVNHFQNFVPIKSTPPVSIDTLPDRWSSAYQPMDNVFSSIYDSLMIPPTLDEWFSTVSSTPNGKASGPSMITYEMLKHLGTRTLALLLILIQACLSKADIPDLWRQAMVFPIPKPHEWKCQLKNTRPITLLDMIRKSLVKLFYNRLFIIMASHDVLKGGNFAGLPGERIRLLASAVKFILLLFTKRTNRVFTAHGSTSAYRVHIGID
ncbi:reverse transcriptase family protein [Rhizophagus irregularis DAOM 181602=DAOM 197198]|nr:reverse transcriptase family protein [Rhizophagus irregularis DAOM 181602=DAOM 197198]